MRSPRSRTASCAATYRTTSQWTGGFQGEVTVHNGRTTPTTAWTATFTYPGGQQISQAWNATVAQNGAAVTAATWGGTAGSRPTR